MIAVETENLTKIYGRGKVKALQDFTLTVEAGQIFSLLGPNGAGKTTLIKTLLGIVFPTGGKARILEEPIQKASVRSRIGYLAESHRFPEFLTARQTLYYYGKMAGVAKADLNRRIPALLKTVNLSEWENVKIRKFSKGMLQRLGIAQALINDAELLFLDEPTDGIDPVGRMEIRDLLQNLRNQGKTVFLNSHLLSEVEQVSDEIAILKNGRLLEKGRVNDFISVKEQFQLKFQGSADEFQHTCSELNIAANPLNEFQVVAVEDISQLNALLDRLREQDFLIEAVIPRKISLEDFFIRTIGVQKKNSRPAVTESETTKTS